MNRRKTVRLTLEFLEDRQVPTLNPSGLEQEMLEQVNRMRMNPAGELGLFVDSLNPIHSTDPAINSNVRYFQVDGTILQSQWSKLVPTTPLAWNESLMNAALGHSNQMISHDGQEHQFPGEPDLDTRLINNGYDATSFGESISTQFRTVFSNHAGFAIDWGQSSSGQSVGGIQDPPGHRNNIMRPAFNEVGISIVEENNPATKVGPLVTTLDFGQLNYGAGNPYILGVVFRDLNNDNKYENGEGLGNINIAIDGVKDFSTRSMSAGGYQVKVPSGTYTLTFSGGDLTTPFSKTVTVNGGNVKVDLGLKSDGVAINTAPVLNSLVKPVLPAINEDSSPGLGTSVESLIGNIISDPDFGSLKGVAVVGLTGNDKGAWEYSSDQGVHWISLNGASASAAKLLTITDKIRFSPQSNFNGTATIELRGWDQTSGKAGQVADLTSPKSIGGISAFSVATVTAAITVVPVNDPPQGADKSITLLEDKTVTLSLSDFGFTDPGDSPANTLSQILITTLPTKGSLTFKGAPVLLNQAISAAAFSTGKFVFSPPANAFGAPFASLGFRVRDNGGTTNGGIDTDPVANTITFIVTSVNDPPVGANKTITINEDDSYLVKLSDFSVQDPMDNPGNGLLSLIVTSLPARGNLNLNGVLVTVGQEISATYISSGKLVFTPAANANGATYASFGFRIRDDGGTANGGVDLAASKNVLTVNVTPVNDAPIGCDKGTTLLEDKRYTLAVADFGFKDPGDSPANSLASVMITALPAQGALAYNGKPVSLNQEFPVGEINLGKLVFAPANHANGANYAKIGFKVRDNGGTAKNGVSLSVSSNTLTFSVTSVNDPPLGANKTVSMLKNTVYTFLLADFPLTDPNDFSPNTLGFVKIVTVPPKGNLSLGGVVLKANTQVNASDIAAGKLKFTPLANATGNPYTSFNFQVGDNGGTANGGINLDPVARVLTLQVNAS